MMHSNEMTTDPFKQLGEWALSAGRVYQSSQTGFVHLYYGDIDSKAQTIPLMENVCFVLALLRSRLVEQIQEAKALLKKILIFQNQFSGPEEGNFPIYLHEYPHCRDPAAAILMLAPFYWILTQFGHVIGSDLKLQLEKAIGLALKHGMRCQQLKSFPFAIHIRLSSAQWAYGMLWEDEQLVKAGKKDLEELSHGQLEGWQTTKQLSEILVGLQMIYPALSNSPWQPLWERMKQTWHRELAAYIGPCVREWQEREEPQVNLYDLFGGFFSCRFSRRATLAGPHQLFGVLIQSSSDKFHNHPDIQHLTGILSRQKWELMSYPDEKRALTVLEKHESYPASVEKTHTALRYIWGDSHRLHSFVCQGGNVEKIKYSNDGKSIILFFDLKDHPIDEVFHSKREVEFFVDFHPEFQFQLQGFAATTFELGQKIELTLGKQKLGMVFDLIEGEGSFVGHLMRGNRPSQIDLKGDKRFHAYDWTIFLRSIRRHNHSKLRATLTFEPIEDGNPQSQV